MTTWGREITVNGVRPKWLADDDTVWIRTGPETETYKGGATYAGAVFFGGHVDMELPPVRVIMLPADHFAYKALDAGFEPWGGGETAPNDWDGGRVLFRDGDLWPEPPSIGARWTHKASAGDIIGYHKRVESLADKAQRIADQLLEGDYVRVKRMTESEARDWAAKTHGCSATGFYANVAFRTLRELDLIREETPLDRFMSAHPDADRATAEKALKWRDGE